MALTKACASVADWNELAQNTMEVTSAIDVSDSYETSVHIQAFLDTETAHNGTEFIVQGSSATTGDEDWYDITRFVDLVGTANAELIDDNPWAAADKTTLVTSTTGYTTGISDGAAQWIAVEDADAATDSELMLMATAAANTSITTLDDKANEHQNDETLYSIAFSRVVTIGIGHYRIRVIVNNTYDINGSTLLYRVRTVKVTAL